MSDATENDVDPTEATKREGAGELSTRTGKRRPVTEHLERGKLVGRYVLVEVLGEGGMGVVYSAFDPELDRKVAIKLLQANPGGSQSGGGSAWLLREAQALARLAHPNVVSVHDVGTLPGDQVFVAMELVDGVTLRKWLKEKQRTWREVLPIMIDAGRGLAAAHAAGLVHRDFKPDNVLVGNDGRVRVMDFGLARLRTSGDTGPVPRASDLEIDTKSPLSESLTQVGTVVGTPAYMAPELYAGEAADAQSDQFSFGITLFEALFGSRPFNREDLLPTAQTKPRPKVPEGTHVPAAIQRSVLRAISLDPAQRFPSIDALVAELAVDPSRKRRRAVIAGVAAVALGVGVAGVAKMSSRPEPCHGIDQRLQGVWDAGVKKKIAEAFAATKKPYAATAFTHLERSLDSHAQEWTKIATESCRATRVRKDQTEEVLSLRQSCLDQRLEELRALTQLLGESDPGVVDKAEKIGAELEPLSQCSNVQALRAPGAIPVELRTKLAPVYKQLAEARAAMIMGRYFPALVASQKALDGARAISYLPAQGEAEAIRGAALLATGNPQDAVIAYQNGVWLSMRGKRDDLAAASALMSAMVSAEVLGKPNEARFWLDLGDAAAARANMQSAIEYRRNTVAGVVLAQAGDNAGGVAAHERAFATSTRVNGPDDPRTWGDEVLLATTLTKAHIYERAVKHFEHALSLREKIVGKDHADIAAVLTNLGVAYGHIGEKEKARAAFERALGIREKLYGPKNPMLVVTLNNFADHLMRMRDYERALPLIERALAIAEKLPGKDHPLYHRIATTHGEILGGAGRAAEARKIFDELLIAEARIASETMPVTLGSYADLELAQKRYAEAVSFSERAIAVYEKLGGTDNPELQPQLITLGKAKLALGDRAAARALFERAIALGTKAGKGELELKPVRDALATLPKE